MYQIKVDKSNKSAVIGKKIGAEFSDPILVNTEKIIRIPFLILS